MDVRHRISFQHSDVAAFNFFSKLGLKKTEIRMKTDKSTIFDIGENDKRWSDISKFLQEHPHIYDFQHRTEYTKAELDAADFYEIGILWEFEYPQPDDDFEYTSITYDSSNYCKKCGAGLKQIEPFSIKKSPKWGKRNIVQLFWIHDEYFVSGSLKSKIEAESEILNFRSVNKYKKKGESEPFDDIFQIDIAQTVDLHMPKDSAHSHCAVCNRKKYVPITRDFFHRPQKDDFTIAHSLQTFGSGYSAYHAVLISKDIYNLFNRIGVKGITYVPCYSMATQT